MTLEHKHNDAVTIEGPEGLAAALVLCEHASNHFPVRFGTLGLSKADQISHAAWDPGALELAQSLAHSLESPLVAAGISRLVYDCNRPPEAASAMAVRSERIDVPGNANLEPAIKQARIDGIYVPFCEAVSGVIDAATPQAVITIHTFTPVYNGVKRDVEIGILHDSDSRLADVILAKCEAGAPFKVRRNQPYGPTDGVTHSLNLHAGSRGILNVMVEVRNDLVATKEGLGIVSTFVNRILRAGLTECGVLPFKGEPS